MPKTDNNMRALTLLLVLLLFLPTAALAQEAEKCDGPYKYLITPEAQPVIHYIPDNGALKNHTGWHHG